MRLLAAAIVFATAPALADSPGNLYELSSPDVGIAWHLHAKDGALICELPCEQSIAPRSGDYLVVHDPTKSWRLDIPDAIQGGDGARVLLQARVGKGHPALGALGITLASVGATTTFGGLAVFGVGLFNGLSGCSVGSSGCPNFDFAATAVPVGAILMAAGALLATAGVFLMEHNKAASSHRRVL